MIRQRLQHREYKDLIAEQETTQRMKRQTRKQRTGLRPHRRPVNPLTGQKLVGDRYRKWQSLEVGA